MPIKFVEYLLPSINVIKKTKVGGNKLRSPKKNGNKIIKILAKSKSWNLSKSKFTNLSKAKIVENASIIGELNFLTSSPKIIFTELRHYFYLSTNFLTF